MLDPGGKSICYDARNFAMTSGLRISGQVVIFLAILTVLGGCSLSGIVKGALTDSKPSATYDLVLDHSRIKRAGRLDTQLVVGSPIAVRALAGDNILVKPSPTEVTYYGRSVWSDRLPKLIQARLVEALRISSRFRAVSDGSDRITGDVTMASTIEAFQIEVSGESAEAQYDPPPTLPARFAGYSLFGVPTRESTRPAASHGT